MAKITRYNGNLLAFGANATGTNRTVFGDTTQSDTLDDNINADYLIGWEHVGSSEFPTLEDFNAMGYTLGQLIAYLHQWGVPEWHTNQEYNAGSLASEDGVLYESQLDSNIGNQPSLDGGTNWLPITTYAAQSIYDNSASGLSATNTNDAIDEVYAAQVAQWIQAALIGSGLSIAGIGAPALTALNGTDVAFIDDGNEELRTYRFDGTNWSLVGNGLSVTGITNSVLAALNGTDVAFIADTLEELRTYRFAFYVGSGPYRPS